TAPALLADYATLHRDLPTLPSKGNYAELSLFFQNHSCIEICERFSATNEPFISQAFWQIDTHIHANRLEFSAPHIIRAQNLMDQ
ncbi:hypothetical protein ABTB91_20055, partial [Acinetobacter baumannii]